MFNISRLETRFQEIVFLLTVMLAMSIAVGGLFYLHLIPENFLAVTGVTGGKLIKTGFRNFGYTYFLFTIFVLHIGHLVLGHAHLLGDVIRNDLQEKPRAAATISLFAIGSDAAAVLPLPVSQQFALGHPLDLSSLSCSCGRRHCHGVDRQLPFFGRTRSLCCALRSRYRLAALRFVSSPSASLQ